MNKSDDRPVLSAGGRRLEIVYAAIEWEECSGDCKHTCPLCMRLLTAVRAINDSCVNPSGKKGNAGPFVSLANANAARLYSVCVRGDGTVDVGLYVAIMSHPEPQAMARDILEMRRKAALEKR